MQRVVQAMPLTAPVDRLTASLSTWADPRFLAPLGHVVDPDGPSGRASGLLEPVASASVPGAPSPGIDLPLRPPTAPPSSPRPVGVQLLRDLTAGPPSPPGPAEGSPTADAGVAWHVPVAPGGYTESTDLVIAGSIPVEPPSRPTVPQLPVQRAPEASRAAVPEAAGETGGGALADPVDSPGTEDAEVLEEPKSTDPARPDAAADDRGLDDGRPAADRAASRAELLSPLLGSDGFAPGPTSGGADPVPGPGSPSSPPVVQRQAVPDGGPGTPVSEPEPGSPVRPRRSRIGAPLTSEVDLQRLVTAHPAVLPAENPGPPTDDRAAPTRGASAPRTPPPTAPGELPVPLQRATPLPVPADTGDGTSGGGGPGSRLAGSGAPERMSVSAPSEPRPRRTPESAPAVAGGSTPAVQRHPGGPERSAPAASAPEAVPGTGMPGTGTAETSTATARVRTDPAPAESTVVAPLIAQRSPLLEAADVRRVGADAGWYGGQALAPEATPAVSALGVQRHVADRGQVLPGSAAGPPIAAPNPADPSRLTTPSPVGQPERPGGAPRSEPPQVGVVAPVVERVDAPVAVELQRSAESSLPLTSVVRRPAEEPLPPAAPAPAPMAQASPAAPPDREPTAPTDGSPAGAAASGVPSPTTADDELPPAAAVPPLRLAPLLGERPVPGWLTSGSGTPLVPAVQRATAEPPPSPFIAEPGRRSAAHRPSPVAQRLTDRAVGPAPATIPGGAEAGLVRTEPAGTEPHGPLMQAAQRPGPPPAESPWTSVQRSSDGARLPGVTARWSATPEERAFVPETTTPGALTASVALPPWTSAVVHGSAPAVQRSGVHAVVPRPLAGDPGRTAVALGIAHADVDGSVVFAAPVVQREEAIGVAGASLPTDAAPDADTPPVAATTVPAGPAQPAAGTATGPTATPDLDELARRLFDPLSARLRAELRLDRERAGVTTDLRY